MLRQRIGCCLLLTGFRHTSGRGDEETARRLLGKEDFSALNDRFKLAAAVLADDDSTAYKLMRKIGKDGGIPLGHYREWPLFRPFRNKPEFDEVVFEIFGERLAKVVVASASSGGGDEPQGDGGDQVRVGSTIACRRRPL